MSDLIEALQIFLKYGNLRNPFHCEIGRLRIVGIDPEIISADDWKRLGELGFFYYSESKRIYSFRYGTTGLLE